MSNEAPLSESVAALTQYFVGDSTMEQTLTRVAELTTTAVPQAEFVGICMMVDGRIGTYIFTHPTVQEIDRAQYDTGDGPCLQAYATGEVISIASTENPTRYEKFCRVAHDNGILSTLSMPMQTTAHRTIGAMNLYAREENAFGADDEGVAKGFAMQAAFVLANAQAYWDARELHENLEVAMQSRAVIEQAKGMIMAALGCDEDRAFRTLIDESQHENLKLRDVARRVVEDARRRGSSNR
jgi:GAF domain-containing protein